MKKVGRIVITITACLVFIYVIGPQFPKPILDDKLTQLTIDVNNVEAYLRNKESKLPVKSGNESSIVWANDSVKEATPYCLLYLHGFSASRMEGEPTHVDFARHFGMNAYLPRLYDHGVESSEPLLHMMPDSLYASAKEALMVAHKLGTKVILMSTSTGGTLSLKLAADFPELVDALILFSPNIQINNPAAFLLSKPWGLQLARQVYGGKYRVVNPKSDDIECRYWNCFYRLEATVYLQQLVDATMNEELFSKVKAPVFLGYYYKDEKHQDEVVRVDAALRMFDQLGTDVNLKRKQAFDAGAHVVACGMYSKAQAEVELAVIQFGEQVLHLK